MKPKPATFTHEERGSFKGFVVQELGSFVRFKERLDSEAYEDLPVKTDKSKIVYHKETKK